MSQSNGRAERNAPAVTPGLIVRPAELARAQPTRWLWRHLIAAGYLNLLIGNEGIGKGTLVAWLVARVTRGELPGELWGIPSAVGILGDEDSFDSVWTTRLHAAGADLALVKQIERPDGGFVDLRENRDDLAQIVESEQLRLLYFDQLLDNLGAGTDDWRQKAVRDALQPLRAVAREFGVAAFGSLHPNKRASDFRQLIAGTAAFNATSRSSLLLAQHPDDEDRRVLVRGKGNLSALPPAIEFGLTSHRFNANEHTFNVPLAADFTESGLTIDELVGQPVELPQAGEARTIARPLIAAALADGEWHPATAIIETCEHAGSYKRAVQRAAADLGAEKGWRGFPAESHWRLPRHPSDLACHPSRLSPLSQQQTPNMALSSSDDSYDRDDGDSTRQTPVTATADGHNGWTDADLQILIDSIQAEQHEASDQGSEDACGAPTSPPLSAEQHGEASER